MPKSSDRAIDVIRNAHYQCNNTDYNHLCRLAEMSTRGKNDSGVRNYHLIASFLFPGLGKAKLEQVRRKLIVEDAVREAACKARVKATPRAERERAMQAVYA